MEQNLWSRSNCGAPHLQNLDYAYRKQITIKDLGSCVEVVLIDCPKFTAIRREVVAGVAMAREIGHGWAVDLDLYLK